MVFLRVRPKQSSLSLGKFKKLSARYCGPYVITKKINNQAYTLMLPPHNKVHNVFHVSLLKKYVPDESHILGHKIALVSKDVTLDVNLERILQTRQRILCNRTIIEHLVKWTRYVEENASWECEDSLLKFYPEFKCRREEFKA